MRVVVRVGMVVAVVAAVAMAGASSLYAQALPTATLHVTKVVEGDVPPGTTFTVEVSCPTIDGGPPTDAAAVDAEDWGGASPEGIPDINETLTFDENGGTQTVDGIRFENRDCTVTETDDGGAESVTYAAGPDNNPENCEIVPGDGSAEANFTFPDECEIVITNTFPAAEPAEVVQLGPTFTG